MLLAGYPFHCFCCFQHMVLLPAGLLHEGELLGKSHVAFHLTLTFR